MSSSMSYVESLLKTLLPARQAGTLSTAAIERVEHVQPFQSVSQLSTHTRAQTGAASKQSTCTSSRGTHISPGERYSRRAAKRRLGAQALAELRELSARGVDLFAQFLPLHLLWLDYMDELAPTPAHTCASFFAQTTPIPIFFP